MVAWRSANPRGCPNMRVQSRHRLPRARRGAMRIHPQGRPTVKRSPTWRAAWQAAAVRLAPRVKQRRRSPHTDTSFVCKSAHTWSGRKRARCARRSDMVALQGV